MLPKSIARVRNDCILKNVEERVVMSGKRLCLERMENT